MQHLHGLCSLFKAVTLIFTLSFGLSLSLPLNASEYAHTKSLRLSANGEILTLLLRESLVNQNLRVTDTRGNAGNTPVKSYIGQIKGDSDSWVRLTESKDTMDGVISRFGKRFRLQRSDNGPVQIKPLAENNDKRITITSAATRNRTAFNATNISEVTHVAKIAIIVDSKYNDLHNGRGLEYALGLINSVDGIYREEFGLALQVETAINVVDSESDPFNYGNIQIERMLRSFRDFRLGSSLLNNDVSLVHLFTGNTPVDEPVGLAWIDTACRSDGYDVGLSTPYKHDILLAAHEIAHNLGALHDTETSCQVETDKVMWPYISSATSQQFSSCSVNAVKRTLARSCHAQAIDLELALAVSVDNTVKATVQNKDLLRENPAATLAIDLPDGGTATTLQGNCTTPSDKIKCSIGALPPGGDSVIVFQVDTAIESELFANVTPNEFVDVTPHNNSGTISGTENGLVVNTTDTSATTADNLQVLSLNGQPETRPQAGGSAGTLVVGTGAITPASLTLLLLLLLVLYCLRLQYARYKYDAVINRSRESAGQ